MAHRKGHLILEAGTLDRAACARLRSLEEFPRRTPHRLSRLACPRQSQIGDDGADDGDDDDDGDSNDHGVGDDGDAGDDGHGDGGDNDDRGGGGGINAGAGLFLGTGAAVCADQTCILQLSNIAVLLLQRQASPRPSDCVRSCFRNGFLVQTTAIT